ncbi:MAG: DNA polymerase III subunit gamma/tau [Prevotellaceae bacterium]|jgi:DNA polymerase-3 subunit gamma/tau|nr:DNA polymerase III subunit gamma/tau [Prevotellaceae bacterium]
MDNYIVSALKYRPATFDSVVGQSTLTTTLKNAIKSNHLAHAYLFCGPRGVGKTTCARIFAKTINCEQLTPDYEACNKCESCVSFNRQRSYNIHELDAASNNGVDDIRRLIEQVRIPPQIGKYSVYIIDEVHMLSSGAFNAFLKTLEEPPAYAIFILATTEKHKILPTILSRCQIYDFNRISVTDTVNHLKSVAQKEGVTVDDSALNVIAQKSDGGMRDALSVFDQLVSFCGNRITYQDAIRNLNVLDYDYYFRLTDAFMAGELTESLLIFNEILNKGFDGHHFITGLSSHFRDLLVSRDEKTVVLLEVGADITQKYKSQAKKCSDKFLFQALKIANDCDLNYRISKNKRLLVELALVRISQLSDEKKKDLTAPDAKNPLKKFDTPADPPPSAIENAGATPKENKPDRAGQETQINRQSTPKYNKRPESVSISVGLENKNRNISERKNEESAAATAGNAKPSVACSEADVVRAWNAFAEKLPIEKTGFSSFMLNNPPVNISGTSYEVAVSNVMQERELKLTLQEILSHIHRNVGNNQITVLIKLLEKTEIKRTLTPEEQFRKMAEKNPSLSKLQSDLNLEID